MTQVMHHDLRNKITTSRSALRYYYLLMLCNNVHDHDLAEAHSSDRRWDLIVTSAKVSRSPCKNQKCHKITVLGI